MSAPPLLSAAGRRRSLVTLPGYLAGRPPRNKGLRYPPDPPAVEEVVAVMRAAGGVHGARMELAHEGVPLNVIQRQLGHTNLGVTSIYRQGIDNAEIIATVHARKAPMIPASTGLRLKAGPSRRGRGPIGTGRVDKQNSEPELLRFVHSGYWRESVHTLAVAYERERDAGHLALVYRRLRAGLIEPARPAT
jgi:hypothetical protein